MLYTCRMLAVGTPAPAFSASDQEGKTHTLADAKGKWLVLYFYPKDDTPGCTKEACGFRDGMGDLQSMGAFVWGVSGDNAESHAAFAKKHGLNFPLLVDSDKTIRSAYEVDRRMTYIIDPSGNIANVYTVQEPEEHPKEVMEDLKRLQSA